MASNDSGTNSALQSSVAFLQIQKNSNLKRSTNMNEDVFRIFRRTGRRIALIGQQVERERCTYLKDSYTEKNQLYKELAGIFNSKKVANKNKLDASSGASVQNSLDHARKRPKDVRSINVNVLKRCECCRRRAFRKVRSNDDEEDLEDEFEDDPFCSGEGHDLEGNNNEKGKQKGARRVSQVSRAGDKSPGRKESGKKSGKTKLVQFSRFDDIRMPTSQRVVQPGFVVNSKSQSGASSPSKTRSKSVCFVAGAGSGGAPTSPQNNGDKARSASTAVRPTLKSRATSIKLEVQNNKNEKLRLDGDAWASHLQNVEEKRKTSATISGLSKAYVAFRKLIRKLDAEDEWDQTHEDDVRADSRADNLAVSRPVSNMSRSERWMPLRRSSVAVQVRLNTWTTGSLEPASLDSFRENNEDEQDEGLELRAGQEEYELHLK